MPSLTLQRLKRFKKCCQGVNNSKVIDYTEKQNTNTIPSCHDNSRLSSSVEENIYPNVSNEGAANSINLTARSTHTKDAFLHKKKSDSIHIKLLKGLREKEAIINSKRSRAFSKNNNLTQAKTLNKSIKKNESVFKKTNKSIEIESVPKNSSFSKYQKYK